jgi:hypothetical protein
MERHLTKLIWLTSLAGFAWTYDSLPQPDGFTVGLGVLTLITMIRLMTSKPIKK